jgi:hypothetical protein
MLDGVAVVDCSDALIVKTNNNESHRGANADMEFTGGS